MQSRFIKLEGTNYSCEGLDPPGEKLPEPIWIPITREEREGMFPCVNVVEETVDYVEI